MDELQSNIQFIAAVMLGLTLIRLPIQIFNRSDSKNDISFIGTILLISATGSSLLYFAVPLADMIAPTLQLMPLFIMVFGAMFYVIAYLGMSKI